MLNRRKRVIVHCHLSHTLNRIREALGRSVELIVAGDVPTLDAALRLYRQVAAVCMEKTAKTDLPMRSLQLASEVLPDTPRIALIDCEATSGVHAVVASGLVSRILLIPFNAAELEEAIGVEPAADSRESRELIRR